MERLLHLHHQLGALGLAALVLMAAAAAFNFMVLEPLETKSGELQGRVSHQARSAETGAGGSASAKLATLYAYLQKDEETTDWLAKLHGIGSATGVQLKSATYRTETTAGRIVRTELVLPVAGSYVQLRDFLQRALTEIPVMSIDQLTLKRESRDDGAVQADLRLTLHMVK